MSARRPYVAPEVGAGVPVAHAAPAALVAYQAGLRGPRTQAVLLLAVEADRVRMQRDLPWWLRAVLNIVDAVS